MISLHSCIIFGFRRRGFIQRINIEYFEFQHWFIEIYCKLYLWVWVFKENAEGKIYFFNTHSVASCFLPTYHRFHHRQIWKMCRNRVLIFTGPNSCKTVVLYIRNLLLNCHFGSVVVDFRYTALNVHETWSDCNRMHTVSHGFAWVERDIWLYMPKMKNHGPWNAPYHLLAKA